MSALTVLTIGPVATLQDQGRPGYLDRGLSTGGAADRLALAEGAALLGQVPACAALEMGGMGGTFQADGPLDIALTGAPMSALLNDSPLAWNASHHMQSGDRLTLGGAKTGVYGYLHLSGGIDVPAALGSRSGHLNADLGGIITSGDLLPAGHAGGARAGLELDAEPRFDGGPIRMLPGMQTPLFAPEVLDRFCATGFKRGGRANRMGVEMLSDGDGFAADGQLNILSEVIVPGDIQMTGTGQPYVLLPDCQTTGGYPRIGTVIPADLPRIAQAAAGTTLTFRFVTLAEAMEAETSYRRLLERLPTLPKPRLRNPADIHDLLSYELISGAVSAFAEPGDPT